MSRITRRYTGKLAATASAALALSRLSALPAHAQAGARILNGAGASFPAVLYSKRAEEYNRFGGVQINYQSVGSGAGIRAHQDMTADFGATDSP